MTNPNPETADRELRDRIAEELAARFTADGSVSQGMRVIDPDDDGDPEPARAVRPLEAADAVLAVLPSVVRARVLHDAALSDAERTMLTYALDQAQERIWSEGGFTAEDQAAVDSLRRLAAEQPTNTEAVRDPKCVCGHPTRLHHEDVCLIADCDCNDCLEPEGDLPARLEAVLTRRFTELGNQFARMVIHEQGPDGWPATHAVGPHKVAEVLRELMADADPERPAVVEQSDTHTPRRGDPVEAWLKGQRDEYETRSSREWRALDEVLDTYRLHADTGTPLDEHVCEGRAVGDCDCLEQPDTQTREADRA